MPDSTQVPDAETVLAAVQAALERCAYMELSYNPRRGGRPYEAVLTRNDQVFATGEAGSLHAALAEAYAQILRIEQEHPDFPKGEPYF